MQRSGNFSLSWFESGENVLHLANVISAHILDGERQELHPHPAQVGTRHLLHHQSKLVHVPLTKQISKDIKIFHLHTNYMIPSDKHQQCPFYSSLPSSSTKSNSHVDFLHSEGCQNCPQMPLKRLQNLPGKNLVTTFFNFQL